METSRYFGKDITPRDLMVIYSKKTIPMSLTGRPESPKNEICPNYSKEPEKPKQLSHQELVTWLKGR